jgi:hypothetical protein
MLQPAMRSIQTATEAAAVKGGSGNEKEFHLEIGNAFDSRSRPQT